MQQRTGARWLPRFLALLLVLLTTGVGTLLGAAAGWSAPDYRAGATLLVSALTGPGKSDPNSVYVYSETQRYLLERMDTLAATAASGEVADAAAAQLGLDPAELRGHITAKARPTTGLIDITVHGARTDTEALARTAVVATAAADAIRAAEVTRAPPAPPLVDATVVDTDSTALDLRAREMRLLATAGGVCGLLLGALLVAIRRPGRWVRQIEPVPAARRRDESEAVDQSIQFEVLGVLLAGQSGKGLAVVAVAAFGVFGYAFTGSSLPPLIAVLIAGVAAVRDPRYAGFAIILTGVSVLPANLSLVSIGPITPTVLEVAIVIGMLVTVARWRPERARGPFTAPVLGILGALVLSVLIGLGRHADFAGVADVLRNGLTLLAFFILREVFRSRPYQLLAVLMVNAAASSLTVLAALPLGLDLLLVQARTEVIIGSQTAEVARLTSPVILLWSPLLIIMAAGLNQLRAQWLLVVPAVIHLALSFNRSTWAPLMILIVLVAALRGEVRGIVVRGAQVLAAGVLIMGLALSGALGASSHTIADRFLSLLNGDFTQETSLSDRVQENGLVLETVRNDPFLGAGAGVPRGPVDINYDELQDRSFVVPSAVLHNQYLLIWVLMGVTGLLAYGWLAVRLTAYSWHLHRRRGDAAVVPVAAAAGVLLLAVQSTLQTNLLDPAAIITIAAMLALIELASGHTDTVADLDGGPARADPVGAPPGADHTKKESAIR